MHTRVENSVITTFYPRSENRTSNQNLPSNKDTENQVHAYRSLKPPGKLSCLREKNPRVGSSKNFSCQRIVIKSKQPSNIPRCGKCGKSSQNSWKCKKLGVRKNKEEEQRNTAGSGKWVASSNLKTAQTFILSSGPTQQSLKAIKEVEDNREPSQQLQLLKIFPERGEDINPVNKSSDVFSITEQPTLPSIISQSNWQPYDVQCDIVDALTSKLISTKQELHETVMSEIKTEISDSHSVNALRKISTYSVMSSQGLHVQATLHPTIQDLELTLSRVSAHYPQDTANANPELLASPVTFLSHGSSFGHTSLSMTQAKTSQFITNNQSNSMENIKDFVLLNENMLAATQDRADGAQTNKENLRSPLRSQQGFIKKNSFIETQMSIATKDKKYPKMSERHTSAFKEAKKNSRGPLFHEQTIIAPKTADDPLGKNLKQIRLSRVNNTTVQSKSCSRRKRQCPRTNSYDSLPVWKPGGVTKMSSTNITKSSDMKENLPQNSIVREWHRHPLEQSKSSTRRQKVLPHEASTEKSAPHLYTRSFNANDMRMIKIYNCLADANLGRGYKGGGTDRSLTSKQKNSSLDINKGSRTRSATDLPRDSNNVCPKSNKACDLLSGILISQPHKSLHSSGSARSTNSNKCEREERCMKSTVGEFASVAVKNNKITTHSRQQAASVCTDRTNSHPLYHETTTSDQKKVHEPPFNSSVPIQKLANKPIKKSLPFVKQNKSKKSINTSTISLNILKEFFYRQGISADLIDRAERDLKRRYGGDGRLITHVDQFGEILDRSDERCQKLERRGVRNDEVLQNEEGDFVKESKESIVMNALTHAQKLTTTSHTQVKNSCESCAALQHSLDQANSSDSRKLVTAETQTLQSFTSLKHVSVGCDEKSMNEPVTDASVETVNLPLFSVSTNTERTDQQSSQSDTSVLNDYSSIKNENLLAERVFDSSSNGSIASSDSSCQYTRSVENLPIILTPHKLVATSPLPVTPSVNVGKKIGRHERSVVKSRNDRRTRDKGRARKSPWSFKKVQGSLKARQFDFRTGRQHYSMRHLYPKRIAKCNSAKRMNISLSGNDVFYNARALSMKRSFSGITLSEVMSVMEVLLCRMDTVNVIDRSSLHGVTPSNSKSVLLKPRSYDSQLLSMDNVGLPSVSSFSVIVRICLLFLVYGIISVFVFASLQFSITCDFGSSHRFS